ncbi:Pumilio y domain member 6 [Coemansia spiralis]|nr:Pumilio y domain member 6 [Coemansia spiralis]
MGKFNTKSKGAPAAAGGRSERPKFANSKDKYNKGKRTELKRKAEDHKKDGNWKRAKPSAEGGAEKKQPVDELKLQARKLWEVLRRGDLGAEERAQKMTEMMALLGGRIKDVTFKHDMSRIVQTCLKHGSAEQREQIAAELAGSYLDLSRSMYGRHILMRMLKYCPTRRAAIIQAFHGQVRKLIRHKDAALVLEECYAVYANAQQKWDLVGEFYGAEFAVFKGGESGAPKSIDAVLEAAPQKRDTVLAALKATVTPLLEKGTVQHSIVHRALVDYLRLADEAGRHEVIEAMRELVVEVLHTRDGAHAGMLCLLHGSPKDRKAIIRSFKPFLKRICCEEYGYAVLVEALDSMDDTVFVNKTLLQDVCALTDDLLGDQFGRRIQLYILGGRSPHYVGSDALKVLQEGDAVRAATSKKDPTQRRRELTGYVSPAMVTWAEQHAATAIFEPLPSQAVSETLLRAHGDKAAAWARVLDLVRADVVEQGAAHVLLSPIANRVVTNCVLAEHSASKSADATLPAQPDTNPKFGSDVLAALEESAQLVPAACAGAFPVRALLESPATAARAKALLAPHKASIAAAMAATDKKRVYEAILKQL